MITRSLLLVLSLLLFGTPATRAQTMQLVRDIHPSGSSSPVFIDELNSRLYFYAEDDNGYGIWRTDGTAAGTEKMLALTGFDIIRMIKANGKFWFIASGQAIGDDLYFWDGETAPVFVAGNVIGWELEPVGTKIFYVGRDAGSGELWCYDDLAGSAYRVKDIYPGSNTSYPTYLRAFNNRVYFSARDSKYNTELWSSDGTAAGTYMVKNINSDNSSSPEGYMAFNNQLFFTAYADTSTDREIWVTDGTEQGTTMFAELTPGGSTEAYFLTECGGKMYFAADIAGVTNSMSLYATDGSSVVTKLPGGYFEYSECFNGHLYFPYPDSLGNNWAMWRSDGTVAGTYLFKTFFPGFTGKSFSYTSYNGHLVLAANDGSNGHELWISDGSYQGTYKPAFSGFQGYNPFDPSYKKFAMFNGKLYMPARYNNAGEELYALQLPALSVHTPAPETPFHIFPNPAAEMVTIQSAGGFIAVCDMEGRLLLRKEVIENETLDISWLRPGLYLIREERTGKCIRLIRH